MPTLAFRSWSAENGFHNQGLESFGLGSSHCFSGPLFRLLNCFLGMSLCRHPGCPTDSQEIGGLSAFFLHLAGLCKHCRVSSKWRLSPGTWPGSQLFWGWAKVDVCPTPQMQFFWGWAVDICPTSQMQIVWGWANVDICPTPQMQLFGAGQTSTFAQPLKCVFFGVEQTSTSQ